MGIPASAGGGPTARLGVEVRLPDLLAAFRHAHPAVDVVINEIVSDAMLEAVRAGNLDLAMVVQREHVSMAGLITEAFVTEPYDIAVSAGHALAQRTAVRLEELAEEPFIMHRPGSAIREMILRACADAGFRPRIALESGEMSAARAFVAAGLGITILPRSSLRSHGPHVHLLALHPALTRTSALVLAGQWAEIVRGTDLPRVHPRTPKPPCLSAAASRPPRAAAISTAPYAAVIAPFEPSDLRVINGLKRLDGAGL